MNMTILERIIELLAKQTNAEPGSLAGDTVLDTLGIDSFDFIEFLFLVEDEFDIGGEG